MTMTLGRIPSIESMRWSMDPGVRSVVFYKAAVFDVSIATIRTHGP